LDHPPNIQIREQGSGKIVIPSFRSRNRIQGNLSSHHPDQGIGSLDHPPNIQITEQIHEEPSFHHPDQGMGFREIQSADPSV
jgi:hypothetical protein